jgi:phospholipid/cholesterol/gamma-HCH transport system substrate-binding protein
MMGIEEAQVAEHRQKSIKVGMLFAAALAFALLFVYWMGAFSFGPTRRVYLLYDFAGGVDRGSPVRLAGIKVGRVSEIDFSHEGQHLLKLTLKISREAFAQITDDSKFYINLAGLIGERYIEIVPGTGDRIANGAELVGISPPRIDQLLSQSFGIFGDLRDFFYENRKGFQETIDNLNVLIGSTARLMDRASPDQRRTFTRFIQNLGAMSDDLREVVGRLNRSTKFMEEKNAGETWVSLSEAIRRVNKIDVNDIRRLMLEDGVKVNFSSKKIPAEVKGAQE